MKTSKFFFSTLIAAAAMSANAWAEDTLLTYNDLFSSEDGWSFVSIRNRAQFSLDTNSQTLSLTNSNWGQSYATYELDSHLTATEDTSLTFSVDLTKQGAGMYSFALIGTTQVFCVGLAYDSNDVRYAVGTDVSHSAYGFGTNWDNGTYLGMGGGTGTGASLTMGTPLTISGKVSYVNDSYSLSLTAGESVITYDLGSFFDVSTLAFAGDGANSTANVTFSNLSLSGAELVVSSLVWNGGASGNWSDASWSSESTTELSFKNGDAVEFATEGAQVTVSGTVAPGTVTISENTTFTGTGTIAVGVGALTIADEKTVSLDAGVTLDLGSTGAIVEKSISGQGIVKVASTATGHAVSVKLADTFEGTVDFTGKLNTGELRLGEGATLKLSKSGGYSSLWGGGTVACNVLFQTDYQIGDSSATTINFSGDVSSADGTTVTILSNSTATFNGSASFANLSSSGMTVFNGDVSGNLVASAGTIRFDAAGTHRTYTSNVTLENSATLSIYDASAVSASSEGNYQFAFTGDIAVNGTNTLASNWGKEIAFQGDLSGEGSLTYTRATDGNVNMNGRLIVDGEDKDFFGTITVDASNNNSLGIDLNASLANATIVLTGGLSNPAFMSIWKDVSVKRLDGTGTAKIGVGYASTSSMTGGNFKLTIGEGEFAGIIQDKSYQRGAGTNPTLVTDGVLGIIKNTEGTLTLSGTNTYSGGTTISAGTLVAADANALGTGSVKVVSGATLRADTAITLTSDLTLAVSDADQTGSGLITGSGVTLDSSAKLLIDIGNLTSLASTDSVNSIALTLAASGALSASEDQIQLGTWNETDWTDYTGNWYVDSWDSTTGMLTLAIPEPSLFGLLAGLGALTLVGTRRRRAKKD